MDVPGESRDHVVDVYRHRAARYDLALELFSLLGYRWRHYRRQAVQALGVQRGDTVVEIGCGTGLNFELVEHAIGIDGRLVGVDLTDAMLAQARHRVRTSGWSNVTLVQADALDFEFPTELNAIISTYALSLVPECAQVIARGCAALSPGGRWVVLDVKIPTNAPRWLQRLGLAAVQPFACTGEWTARRDWETVRAAMQTNLTDISWTELFFGFTYLAVGARRHDP
jgi:demethylmenaquinone methyltransferase/2-methoxy-6-polyprenyl-1,4-benzoquinol methylase